MAKFKFYLKFIFNRFEGKISTYLTNLSYFIY